MKKRVIILDTNVLLHDFTLWGPIEDVNQPKLMTPQVKENKF